MKMKFALLVSALSLGVHLHAATLNIVNVSAPEINCLFDTSCSVTATDTSDSVSVYPVASGSGQAFLQSRTFTGSAGTPAAGLYAYLYRLDLTALRLDTGYGDPFVHTLTFNCGPIVNTLDLNGDGVTGDQVMLITNGGLGTQALTYATKTGNSVSFHMHVAPGFTNGQSTYFFGFVSTQPPTNVFVQVEQTSPDGMSTTTARAPRIPSLTSYITHVITNLSINLLNAPTVHAKEGLRQSILNRVAESQSLVDDGDSDSAAEVLLNLQSKMDGNKSDWVIDDPATQTDERADLYDDVQSLIDEILPVSP